MAKKKIDRTALYLATMALNLEWSRGITLTIVTHNHVVMRFQVGTLVTEAYVYRNGSQYTIAINSQHDGRAVEEGVTRENEWESCVILVRAWIRVVTQTD